MEYRAELMDTGDSVASRALDPIACNMKKGQFNDLVTRCVNYILRIGSDIQIPDQDVPTNKRNPYLMYYVINATEEQQNGFFGTVSVNFVEQLAHLLYSLGRKVNRDECAERILDGYSVHVFREAIQEYRKLISERTDEHGIIHSYFELCRDIASLVVLRELIERIYPDPRYQFGSKDTLKQVSKDILFLKRTH
jgi:hypothetical protein